MRYPVPGYAVVHERGTVLFDTGLHESLITSSDLLGALAAMFTVELTPGRPRRRSGWRPPASIPASVTHVVNSHLHFDHCGHNGPFADAVTLVQAPEWEAAQRPTKYAYAGVPLDEIGGGDLRLVDGEVDLFGDGTVVLVPTPGSHRRPPVAARARRARSPTPTARCSSATRATCAGCSPPG